MRDNFFLNQGAVIVEVHTKLGNDGSNKEMKQAIRNHPLIHATRTIIVLNVTIGTQIHALDVYQRIIPLQIVKNQTLQIKTFTGTQKILKLVHTYRQQ